MKFAQVSMPSPVRADTFSTFDAGIDFLAIGDKRGHVEIDMRQEVDLSRSA